MSYPPAPEEQPPDTNPESVLCDRCKKPVLEPSKLSDLEDDNRPLSVRLEKIKHDWLLTRRLWPIGYIIASPYSPFRVEKELKKLPRRDWRDAFEDLLAFESGGEIISEESRKRETVTAVNLGYERAKFCIDQCNETNIRYARVLKKVQTTLSEIKSPEHRPQPSIVPYLNDTIERIRESIQRRVELAHSFKAIERKPANWPASRHKERAQWMASLITSGALTGWTSTLADSQAGHLYYFQKQGTIPEEPINCTYSEIWLGQLINGGDTSAVPPHFPPMYKVANPPPARLPTDLQILDEDSWPSPPPDRPALWSKVPESPCFRSQKTSAERITLPGGKTAMRVVMKNRLTNGEVEEKVIVEGPCKVLQEVEKAKALIENRMAGFDP